MGDEENHRDVAGSTFMERQRSDIFSNVPRLPGGSMA